MLRYRSGNVAKVGDIVSGHVKDVRHQVVGRVMRLLNEAPVYNVEVACITRLSKVKPVQNLDVDLRPDVLAEYHLACASDLTKVG